MAGLVSRQRRFRLEHRDARPGVLDERQRRRQTDDAAAATTMSACAVMARRRCGDLQQRRKSTFSGRRGVAKALC